MAGKKLNQETQEVENTTQTDLVILKNLEKALYRNNPTFQKRNTEKSLDWFRKYIPRAYNRVKVSQMMRDRSMWTKSLQPGKMYFFEYDAKHKDTLPVWDRYPLIFPWDSWRGKDGKLLFIGINLHYLPPQLRFVAMRELLKLRNEKRYRKSTRLKLSWDMLKGLSNSRLYEHSIKMYRLDHVKTTFIEVPSVSWEMVAFLPLARFQKGGKGLAWSIKKKV